MMVPVQFPYPFDAANGMSISRIDVSMEDGRPRVASEGISVPVHRVGECQASAEEDDLALE